MQGAVFYRFLRLSNRLKTVEPGTPTFCTASGSGDRRRSMPHFGQLLPCSVRVGYLPHSTPHGARADLQTEGLNGVFAHFCRRGQKWVAPRRETSLPCQQARKNHRGGAVHQLAVRKAVPLKKQPVRRTGCFLHHARGEGTNSRFRSACVGIPSSAALSLYCHMSKA